MHRISVLSIVALFFCLETVAQLTDVRSFGTADMRRFEARMVDGQLAYMLLPAVDSNAMHKVVYTADGGNSWQELPLPNYTPTQREGGLNVHFTTTNSAIMVIHDRIYHTQNAGQSWTLKLSHSSGFLVSCFDGPNAIVMAGYGGSYWITTDGGQQWTPKSSGTSQDIAVGCRCKDDQGYLWYSPNASGQTFIRLKFSDQSTISTQRTGFSEQIPADMNILRSFYAVKEGDWLEGLYDFKRTQNFGQTFSLITAYQPYLIQGYSLGAMQSELQVFYSLFDSAVVIAYLDDLSLKDVFYRLPDSLKIYSGLVFGDYGIQFMVCVAATEQPGANQWAVQDIKLVRRQGMLLNVAENQLQPLAVYPNPAQDRLFISGAFLGEEEVSVLDVSGRVVFQTKYDISGFDVSQLQPGVYVLRMQDGVKTRIARFIKE